MSGSGTKNTRRSIASCALAFVLAASFGGAAFAEEEPFSDLVASSEDGRAYQVSGIVPAYVERHPDHPDLATVLSQEIELGQVEDGWVAPREGVPSVRVQLAELAEGDRPGVYYASALAAVNRGILTALNRQGLGGVAVQTSPADIDPVTGEDRRPGGQGAVAVEVHTGRITGLRVVEVETFCFGDGCEEQAVGSPQHERIREGSPIQPTGTAGAGQTDLLRTDELEDYVAYLNRHPGRRVVAEITPSRIEPGTAMVDYKIVEDKPWSVYTQGSNTGTRETQHWRQRTGYRNTQLTGNDDVLRLDWVTDGNWGTDVRGVFASYDVPIGFGEVDRLRFVMSGAYSDYDASDIGVNFVNFTGRNHVAGGEFVYNAFQDRDFFVDVAGGARWTSVRVDNDTFNVDGHESYWLPRIALRASQETDVVRLFADVSYETSMGAGSALSQNELNKLGRVNVDDGWANVRYFGRFDAYLDPLLGDLLPELFDGGRRGHELILEVKGQYTTSRLIPQEEQIAGGLYTVRGYDQALLAGDTVFISRNEYVLHIPRLLGVRRQPAQLPGVGDFRVAPQHAAGRPDWDLTLNLFLDVGVVDQNDREIYEIEQSIWGYGVGFGVQFLRNLSFQYYYGRTGRDVEDPLNVLPDFAERGDHNQYIQFTLLY